jgi:hypothetical protein
VKREEFAQLGEFLSSIHDIRLRGRIHHGMSQQQAHHADNAPDAMVQLLRETL